MLDLHTFTLVVVSVLQCLKGSLQILHWLCFFLLPRLHGQLIYYEAVSIFYFHTFSSFLNFYLG